MRIIKEAYTPEEIETRIADTRNIINALSDSLTILQSALEDADESNLASYVRSLIVDVDDLANDFYTYFEDYYSEEDEDLVDIEDEDTYNENMINESAKGSVEDYFSKMKGKSKSEAEKIVMKAKGNPNAEEAYKKYLELNEGAVLNKINESSEEDLDYNLEKLLNDYFRYHLSGSQTWADVENIDKIDDNTYKVDVRFEETFRFDAKDADGTPYTEYEDDETYDTFKVKVDNGKIISVNSIYESINEDTVKTSDGKWTNKGDTGKTHGKFKTKKEADAQRKAIFANGFKESLDINFGDDELNRKAQELYDNGIVTKNQLLWSLKKDDIENLYKTRIKNGKARPIKNSHQEIRKRW